MPQRFPLILVAFWMLASGPAAQAENRWSANSGAHRTALLELYTSEGCSSCPPADRWLRTLKATGLAPVDVVPLAFHVDYWDSLGWKDRFADPSFSLRQRERARQASTSVYTPQFLVNGNASMDTRAILRQLRRIATEPAAYELGLTVAYRGGVLRIDPRIESRPGMAEEGGHLYVAVYENGLVTEVLAGENRGRVLQHDYVVRHLHGPIDATRTSPASLRIPLGDSWDARRLGVAVFVQHSRHGEVMQALNLSLTELQP